MRIAKRLIGPALLTLLVFTATNTSSAQPSAVSDSYFPLAIGNHWTYVVDGPSDVTEIVEVEVVGAFNALGREICRVDGYFFDMTVGEVHLCEVDGTTFEYFEGKFEPIYRWTDLVAPVVIPGYEDDCVHGATGRFVQRTPVIVPAGSFERTLTIRYLDVPCCDAGPASETFAPGVGLIERQVLTIAGIRTWRLLEARLGGRVVGSPSVDVPDGTDQPGSLELSSWSRMKELYR